MLLRPLSVLVSGFVLAAPLAAGAQPAVPALGQPGTLAQELAATRRAGLPTRPGDVAGPVPPASRNAATYYVRLSTIYERIRETPLIKEAGSLPGRAPMTPQQLRTARLALRTYPEVSRLVHQAVACERCVFRRDWSQGAALRVPEFTAQRFAVRWLALEAGVQSAEGKPAASAETRALGFRVAGHAASDVMLLGGLVASSCSRSTIAGLTSLLYASAGDPRVVGVVRRELARGPAPPDLARSLRSEVVTALVSVRQVREGGPSALAQLAGETSGSPSAPGRPMAKPRNWGALMDSNAAYLLWFYRQLVAASKLPYPRQRLAVDRLQADLDRRLNARDLDAAIAAIVLPHFPGYLQSQARTQADAACLRAGAVLLAYRAAHGAFPRSLGQAVSPVPTDVYDGKPLRYRLEGKGFVVYSVGSSLAFDGGTPAAKPPPAESLFRWPKPAYWGMGPQRPGAR